MVFSLLIPNLCSPYLPRDDTSSVGETVFLELRVPISLEEEEEGRRKRRRGKRKRRQESLLFTKQRARQ